MVPGKEMEGCCASVPVMVWDCPEAKSASGKGFGFRAFAEPGRTRDHGGRVPREGKIC